MFQRDTESQIQNSFVIPNKSELWFLPMDFQTNPIFAHDFLTPAVGQLIFYNVRPKTLRLWSWVSNKMRLLKNQGLYTYIRYIYIYTVHVYLVYPNYLSYIISNIFKYIYLWNMDLFTPDVGFASWPFLKRVESAGQTRPLVPMYSNHQTLRWCSDLAETWQVVK